MMPVNPSYKKYRYHIADEDESRCQNRLQVDLGVDEDTAGVILRLRRQVIDLQNRVNDLEAELAGREVNRQSYLAHIRQEYIEAAWIEVEIEE